jgi:Peptidase family S41
MAIDVAATFLAAGIASTPLAQFLAGIPETPLAERRSIVQQALLLVDDIYVHLPLKVAMHAVDPVQRLRLLGHRLDTYSNVAFHREMLSIFSSLRDLHTNYFLPLPYNRNVAVLPFEIGEFFEGGKPKYVVTSVFAGLNDPHFKPGVAPTHWNGVPIDRAVEANADRFAGSNVAARHARGLQRLTVRPLAQSLPPDEEWVDLRFFAEDGQFHEVRFPWLVISSASKLGGGMSLGLEAEATMGLDAETEDANRTRRQLFQQKLQKIEDRVLAFLVGGGDGLEAVLDFSDISTMPELLSFATLPTPQGDVGYIRIHSFAAPDATAFVIEVVRILGLLPKKGLILDVRGNGGGNITAGERLLQLFSSGTIEPERFQLQNTARTLELVKGTASMAPWRKSMDRAVETGSVYSQGLPVTDPALANDTGRKYPGPVVLLIDAFCYSTTDIFAAGFQDHGIGRIIGTATHTGAGGANVFTWTLLKQLFDATGLAHPFKTLPGGGEMRVAIRQSTRVGPNAGVLLEDLGVEPDALHLPTRRDLLEDDADLLDFAAALLLA